jgi:hypothetical protein
MAPRVIITLRVADLYAILHVFAGSFLALLACWCLVVRPYLVAQTLAARWRASDAQRRQLQAAYDEAASELPRAKL